MVRHNGATPDVAFTDPSFRPVRVNLGDYTLVNFNARLKLGEGINAFARIENHFFVHAGWLEEGQLLRDAYKLKDIPGVIIHGRYDMPCPAKYAWALHKAWPEAKFEIVWDAGHASTEPGIIDGLIRATDAALRV